MAPKCYEIFLLKEGVSYTDLKDSKTNKGLNELYIANKDKVVHLRNKKPEFSSKHQAYMMDFKGRVQKGSVKNFIIEDAETKKEVLMFGKSGEDLFSLYISYPFTPFMAMGIVLPQFASKFLANWTRLCFNLLFSLFFANWWLGSNK